MRRLVLLPHVPACWPTITTPCLRHSRKPNSKGRCARHNNKSSILRDVNWIPGNAICILLLLQDPEKRFWDFICGLALFNVLASFSHPTPPFNRNGPRERILFELNFPDLKPVSTDSAQPALLTSLTYQSLTLPSRQNDQIESLARQRWMDRLLEESHFVDREEVQVWLDDLRANNPEYFRKQFSSHQKYVRDELSRSGDSVELLHPSSRDALDRLVENNVGLIILDECHHLLGHWGRVLADAIKLFHDPIIVGLTATPPDRQGKDERDLERYDQFFGPIDFEVPVPAVVKDGYLAPYQDLVYFVRPTTRELKFVASADERLEELIELVCQTDCLAIDEQPNGNETTSNQPRNLVDWLLWTLENLKLPSGTVEDWNSFQRRDPTLALAARQFLVSRNIQLPEHTPALSVSENPRYQSGSIPDTQFVIPVLDRFVRHCLRRSSQSSWQELAGQITASLRTLGIQITDTGTRACTSPVGRVMAYSQGKTAALIPILHAEMANLDDAIRAVVIADFEKSSAVSAQLKDLMDGESGGAVAAFKTLLTDSETDKLDPILLTGSTILIDDEIEHAFLEASREWLGRRKFNVQLESKTLGHFRQIIGSGTDWAPRVYVELVTELFQQGLTRCLIGTRGLLGEGWDANRINVLIDLTTVTTSMSINQLRGRSFRLDPNWKDKLANNWDVVCLAPEFSKGFDDYRRFQAKHQNLYGVTDDGAIEKGVGHVHPAFTDLKPEGLESDFNAFNDDMLARSQRRDHVRDLWKIGQPFRGQAIRAVEVKIPKSTSGGFPPFRGSKSPWNANSLTQTIAEVVLKSLVELNKIERLLDVHTGELAGGYVRSFLDNASPDDGRIFAEAMKQVMGPLNRPRYVIPRSVEIRVDSLLSRFLPEIIGKYFRKHETNMIQLHAVPDSISKNKAEVEVFERHWNETVSPGKAVFALRGKGEELVHQAAEKLEEATILHDKEVFV